MKKHELTRRRFLRAGTGAALAVLGAPAIIPGKALGKNGHVTPGNKITIGCIGVGWMGTGNLESFLKEPDVQILAVCDVDENHLENARKLVNENNENQDCTTYHDFRDLLDRADIDAVSLGLPDHWHAIPAITAAMAGKDIYGEKPLSHSLVEGRAMCDVIKKYDRIWQTGSWQRSESHFRFAAELVRNGRIGKVHTVEVGLPAGHTDFAGTFSEDKIAPPPKELDYDFWLGPAPYKPYIKSRHHKNWRWDLDFGGGQILDWIGHHLDIAHWGLGFDYTGPIEVEGHGEYPRKGIYNTATKYKVFTKYTNGVELIIAGGHSDIRSGTKWIGDLGWVWVNRGGRIESHPGNLLTETFGPDEVRLYRSPGHWRNFIDCVKSRALTIAPCEVAHRSATPGHLGQISMLSGRKIYFNPETEQIRDDPTASRMLGSAMRAPWKLEI